MSSKTNRERVGSNRMTSIARKINMEFWLREFSHLLILDITLILVVAGAFFWWRESIVPDSVDVVGRYFEDMGRYETWRYVVEGSNGVKYGYFISRFLELCKVPAVVVLVVEVLMVLENFFGASTVRRKMKPLNEIAIQAEKLSNLSGQMNMSREERKVDLSTMEKAISKVDPDKPNARVTTGDKELQSLEIAINNLLDRMRESYRQQERFVSDASHELRTPIAVIQGYVNMLDRWGKDDEQILKESIEALKNESEHMKNLVEQLLFLARGDSGRNTLNMDEFNLTEMVQDVMEESAMIDEKHVYRFLYGGGSAEQIMVKGDMAMLKQALRIFVQNASKYSNEGDTITFRAGLDGQGRPFYSVQDEGAGMQSSEVVHVFERFYRSDSARNSAQGGTGLGLAIAKWIVDAHGGAIEILSRPEFGSRITVRL